MKYVLAILWDIGLLYLYVFLMEKGISLFHYPTWWVWTTFLLFVAGTSFALFILGAIPWVIIDEININKF